MKGIFSLIRQLFSIMSLGCTTSMTTLYLYSITNCPQHLMRLTVEYASSAAPSMLSRGFIDGALGHWILNPYQIILRDAAEQRQLKKLEKWLLSCSTCVQVSSLASITFCPAIRMMAACSAHGRHVAALPRHWRAHADNKADRSSCPPVLFLHDAAYCSFALTTGID
ncbi:hypothetical protein V8C44DRAFT_188247 [Trichoderma aethiopicum]